MRNTTGLKILGIVALLSLIAGAVSWVNARKSREVESLLTTVKETYVPSYAALARAHIRSLEESPICVVWRSSVCSQANIGG
jgi:hypothetical protein